MSVLVVEYNEIGLIINLSLFNLIKGFLSNKNKAAPESAERAMAELTKQSDSLLTNTAATSRNLIG